MFIHLYYTCTRIFIATTSYKGVLKNFGCVAWFSKVAPSPTSLPLPLPLRELLTLDNIERLKLDTRDKLLIESLRLLTLYCADP